MLKINAVHLFVIRNEFEYNFYVSSKTKEERPFSEAELPMILVKVEKHVNGLVPLECQVSFSPAADFATTSYAGNDFITVNALDTSVLDVDFNESDDFLLSVITEMGISDGLQADMYVNVREDEDSQGLEGHRNIPTIDELMNSIMDKVVEQGDPVGDILLESLVMLQKLDSAASDIAYLYEAINGTGGLNERVEALENPV